MPEQTPTDKLMQLLDNIARGLIGYLPSSIHKEKFYEYANAALRAERAAAYCEGLAGGAGGG
jgi:hypothetical protein